MRVNGEDCELFVEPRTTLLEVVREKLSLKGAKEACDTGECGSCTLLLDGKPVNSCLVLAVDARDRDVTTIEGLARGPELHPLQEAFINHGAIQCGYCTPGVILAAKALLQRNPNPTLEDVKRSISGNLCRCTGYAKIIKAILAAASGGIGGPKG